MSETKLLLIKIEVMKKRSETKNHIYVTYQILQESEKELEIRKHRHQEMSKNVKEKFKQTLFVQEMMISR